MSKAAKVTLCASLALTASIISYIHYSEDKAKKRMRQGVLNDLERQAQKKRDLEEQQTELSQIFQREQNKDSG